MLFAEQRPHFWGILGVGPSNFKFPKTHHNTPRGDGEEVGRARYYFGFYAKGERGTSKNTIATNKPGFHSARPALLPRRFRRFPLLPGFFVAKTLVRETACACARLF